MFIALSTIINFLESMHIRENLGIFDQRRKKSNRTWYAETAYTTTAMLQDYREKRSPFPSISPSNKFKKRPFLEL